MKKLTKTLPLVLAMLMLAGIATPALGGATEVSKTIQIQAVIDPMYAKHFREDPIKDTTLQDIAKQALLESTGGVEMDVEWFVPSGSSAADRINYLNMSISAGTLPEVLVMNDLPNDPASMEIVHEQQVIVPLTKEMIVQNMPLYTARIEKYGASLDEILAANTYEGFNYYVPAGFHPNVFSNVRKDLVVPAVYYGLLFRDDILNQIFPDARTEAELAQLLVEKGELTVEDLTGDISVMTLDGLYDYLVKVKELGLAEGSRKVIPAQLFSSNQMPTSLLWSLCTASGNGWHWPLRWSNNVLESEYLYMTEGFYKYCEWLNKCFNEGLLDPEIFVAQDSSMNEKASNGEYAVFTAFINADVARQTGRERGYGYRWVPFQYPLDMTELNNSLNVYSLKASGPMITTSAKEEDIAAILHWIDYYLSEEYDELRFWGSPDWYEGEGTDRRYKPEYKAVEDWVLYGQTAEMDGTYYHMSVPETLLPPTDGDSILQTQIRFTSTHIMTYPDGPYWTIPKEPASMDFSNVDMSGYTSRTINASEALNLKYFIAQGWAESTAFASPEMQAFDSVFWAEELAALYAKAIVASSDQFGALWNEYVAAMEAAGVSEAVETTARLFADYFENQTIPVN